MFVINKAGDLLFVYKTKANKIVLKHQTKNN